MDRSLWILSTHFRRSPKKFIGPNCTSQMRPLVPPDTCMLPYLLPGSMSVSLSGLPVQVVINGPHARAFKLRHSLLGKHCGPPSTKAGLGEAGSDYMEHNRNIDPELFRKHAGLQPGHTNFKGTGLTCRYRGSKLIISADPETDPEVVASQFQPLLTGTTACSQPAGWAWPAAWGRSQVANILLLRRVSIRSHPTEQGQRS
ncbi:hypothetical protein ATANTOWER_024976 [Ataeniobius toweri]|uniref:Uncharacterized protein n=1 Tax=Ataeniobius toweri TaxID=208326 RepID=A0ABU7CCF1_9TELE|nr:hypothetical protein [Ataeniobius toweri]